MQVQYTICTDNHFSSRCFRRQKPNRYRCAKLTTTQTGTASQMHARQTIAVFRNQTPAYRKIIYSLNSPPSNSGSMLRSPTLTFDTSVVRAECTDRRLAISAFVLDRKLSFLKHTKWTCPARGSTYAYRRLAQEICDTLGIPLLCSETTSF